MDSRKRSDAINICRWCDRTRRTQALGIWAAPIRLLDGGASWPEDSRTATDATNNSRLRDRIHRSLVSGISVPLRPISTTISSPDYKTQKNYAIKIIS